MCPISELYPCNSTEPVNTVRLCYLFVLQVLRAICVPCMRVPAHACACFPAFLSVCRLWHSVLEYDAHVSVSGMSDPEMICQRPHGVLM